MTDITGTRIKPGDVLVFNFGEDDGLGFSVVLDTNEESCKLASVWWELNILIRTRAAWHRHDNPKNLLIVGHAAQLDKPTWPRELRNWIYETWEEHRRKA